METTFIYVLLDPRDGEIRYVGRSDQPAKRLRQHISESAKLHKKSHRCNWLRFIVSIGLVPLVEVIEEVSVSCWQERERYWIAHYRSVGAKLVNATDGGEGLINPTVETRRRIGLSKIGNRNCIGRVVTVETRMLMSEAAKGNRHTLEVKTLMSKSRKGRIMSKETREKIAVANRGRVVTDETRRKLSESLKGKPLSDKHRAALSKARKGRPKSGKHSMSIGAAVKTARRSGPGAKLIDCCGESYCLAEWAERSGTGYTTIRERLKRGWSVKDAIFGRD